MSVQTSYDDTPAVGFSGLIAESFSQRQIDSYMAEGGGIRFGDAVESGTDPEKQKVVLATAANFNGVAVASLSVENQSGPASYAEKEAMPVMLRGRFWGESGGAVTVGAELLPSTGTNTTWTAAANTGAQVRAVARSAAAGSGELILIELVGPEVAF